MAQILAGDRKQHASENKERPERYSLNLARITGVLLLLASIGGTTLGLVGALSGTWGDPNAEDHAAVAFAAYQQHPLIPLFYYCSMIAGILFIVLAPLLYLNLARVQTPLKLIAVIFQVLAGLVQALAASRWVIMLPIFAQAYADPKTSAMTRAALDVNYQAISYFLGLTLGEHFYNIFAGIWTLLLAISLLRAPGEKTWLGWLGVAAGIFLLLASFEQLDLNLGNILLVFVFGGMLLWLVWVVSLAFTLLINRPRARFVENRI